MNCPRCKMFNTKVVDSRNVSQGMAIRRRRECNKCGYRFTTYEKVEGDSQLFVIKKNGQREDYKREKILKGLLRASEKRKISIEILENIVIGIEDKLENSLKNEISTTEIGEIIMKKLSSLDKVAYVRFASVYKDFKDLDSFVEEIKGIQK